MAPCPRPHTPPHTHSAPYNFLGMSHQPVAVFSHSTVASLALCHLVGSLLCCLIPPSLYFGFARADSQLPSALLYFLVLRKDVAMARDGYRCLKTYMLLKSQYSILTRIHFSGKNMDGHLMSPRGIHCQHFLGRENSRVTFRPTKGQKMLSYSKEESASFPSSTLAIRYLNSTNLRQELFFTPFHKRVQGD